MFLRSWAERLLLVDAPEATVVFRDVNSTMAVTKLHIPVVRVEAGLRSFDHRIIDPASSSELDTCTRGPTEQRP